MQSNRGLVVVSLTLSACASAPAARSPHRPAFPGDSVEEAFVAPGVWRWTHFAANGPWAVNVIDIDLSACGVELRTAKASGRVIGRETTSVMAAAAEAELQRPILGAINADFFSFDPPGRPEGAQVSNGVVVKSENRLRDAADQGRRIPQPAFALDASERPFIIDAAFEGWVRLRTSAVPLAGVNATLGDGVVLYNHFAGEETPADSAAREVVVRMLGTTSQDSATGIVVAVDTLPAGVRIDASHVVLATRGPALGSVAAGDTVRYVARFPPVSGRVTELIGGFPRLLRDGEPVHRREVALNASFSEQRHPRSAIGWRADGRVLVVAVDGRQPGYSVGMTLDELASYMRVLGAREALNLDGGGSTTLLVRGRVLNRPSDTTGERPVANALLVLGPAPGQCRATTRGEDR
ncbi:MAG: phosphodiester glycosidase family protein [Longimicrobiales bacterium]